MAYQPSIGAQPRHVLQRSLLFEGLQREDRREVLEQLERVRRLRNARRRREVRRAVSRLGE